MSTGTLSDRHQAFADQYVKLNFNGTQAAITAGYAETGAHVTANRLLKNPKIRSAIEARKREVADAMRSASKVSPAEIITGLHREATDSRSPAARVSAWRTLADIHGMLGGAEAELPPGLSAFMAALGRGLAGGQGSGSVESPVMTLEARMVDGDEAV